MPPAPMHLRCSMGVGGLQRDSQRDTRREGWSAGGARSQQVGDCVAGASVEHPLNFELGHAKRRSRVSDIEQGFIAGSESRVVPGPERRSPASGALRRDQPFAGVRVPAGEDRGEVVSGDRSREAGGRSRSTEPPAGFLASVGVVALWSRRPGSRRPRCRVAFRGGWLEVADDRVDDPGGVGPATAQG